jgi:hypothetical protein
MTAEKVADSASILGIRSGQGAQWPDPSAYIGLGLIGFGWGCAGDLSMAYLMDAYPEIVLEGMVGVAVINNTIACKCCPRHLIR